MLVLLNYYQHRGLYGNTTEVILQVGVDRYLQEAMDYLGLSDSQLSILLQSQIPGLLLMRMVRDIKVPLLEQMRPFVEMLVDYVRKTSSAAEECSGSLRETRQDQER